MRFPNMYDSALAPGIEPGSAAWELSVVPRRHSDIHLEKPELQLFIQQNFSLKAIKKKFLSWDNAFPDYI